MKSFVHMLEDKFKKNFQEVQVLKRRVQTGNVRK